jgi:hypothetical protein
MIAKKQSVLLNSYRAYFPSDEYENLAPFTSSTVAYQKLEIRSPANYTC